jgi:hypothetical protein
MKKILFFLVLFFLSSIAFADEYVLVMSKDDNVCQHMLKIYNEDLKQYGQVRYDQHKEFNWIRWQDKGIRLRPASNPKATTGISAKIALFDINNDSKEEAIVYHPSTQADRPIDVYDVFPCDVLTMLNEDDIVDGETLFSRRMKSFLSSHGIPVNVYDISEENIKKLPERTKQYIVIRKNQGKKDIHLIGLTDKINFLRYKNHFHIAFEGPSDIGPGEDWNKVEQYNIISEYQQDNTLNHQCLYLIKKDISSERRAK